MTRLLRRPPGELEQAVLEVLWRRGPSTAREVLDALAPTRELAYTTVLTVLRRLKAKRLVGRRGVANRHVYQATVAEDEVRRHSAAEVVERFFGGSPAELIAQLVEDEKLSAKELKRIEELVRKYRKEQG